MKKVLFICLIFPALAFSQSNPGGQLSPENKSKQLERSLLQAANFAANQTSFSQNKSLKQVLDSVVYEEFYSETSSYERYYKYAFAYDVNGRNKEQYLWIYDFQDDTLAKTINTFNVQNQLELSVMYTNDGSGWELDSKRNYYYDVNGYPLQQIDSTYNGTAYEIYLTLNFTYDANYRLTEVMGILADDLPTIYGDQKLVFEYNPDGTIHSNLLQFEDIGFPTYSDVRHYTFDYVGSNSSVTHEDYYNSLSHQLEDSDSMVKFYNTGYTKADLLLPTGPAYLDVYYPMLPEDLVGSYTNRLDSVHVFDLDYGFDGRMRYFYEQKDILGILENELAENVMLYPNPTNGKIKVANLSGNYTVEVFDLFGKKIIDAKNAKEIDLSGFAGGIYHLQIKNEKGQVSSQKISLNK